MAAQDWQIRPLLTGGSLSCAASLGWVYSHAGDSPARSTVPQRLHRQSLGQLGRIGSGSPMACAASFVALIGGGVNARMLRPLWGPC